MKLATIECIFKSLNDAGVVYLVAGGLNSCSKYQYTLGITVRPELVEGQAD